uniref:GIY-YIG nuclease family protein n=2 Tax=Gelidibacter sp. TaxID=2018083 RepID=UPI00404A0C28
MKFYYVYMLECSDGSFYVGISSNIEKRLDIHNSGINRDSYTYSRRPVVLKWMEMFTNPEQAIAFEKQLKGWSRRKKIALINEDWNKLIEYSRNYTQFGKYIDEDRSSTSSD